MPLPVELDIFQNSIEFREYGWTKLCGAAGDGDIHRLDVEVWYGSETRQRWRVDCRGVREAQVSPGHNLGAVELESEHVVLLPHGSECADLLFTGIPENAKAVLADLWIAHRKVADGWFPFERFLNTTLPLPDLLAGGFGKLADGPVRLLKAYSDVLTAHGMKPQVTDGHRPPLWRDSQWHDDDATLTALIMEPGRFVVAESFDFTALR